MITNAIKITVNIGTKAERAIISLSVLDLVLLLIVPMEFEIVIVVDIAFALPFEVGVEAFRKADLSVGIKDEQL